MTDWPDSDLNFSFRLQQLTALKVNPEPISPGDDACVWGISRLRWLDIVPEPAQIVLDRRQR